MEALLAPAPAADDRRRGGRRARPAAAEAKPIKGISLILGVLGDRIRRLFTRSRS